MRDQETGYYSAAVLDFDDNSIEAMHRKRLPERSNQSDVNKGDQRVLSWQKDVAQSSVSNSSQARKVASQIVVNNITTPTTIVLRHPPTAREDTEISAQALVGTLLGAAAGAVVAYAMAKGEAESPKTPATQTVTYQTIEANNSQRARSVLSSRRSYPPSSFSHTTRPVLMELEYPKASNSIAVQSEVPDITSSSRRLTGPTASVGKLLASTLIDTFVPPSEIRPFPPHAIARSHTDSVISRSCAGNPSFAVSQHSKTSHASSTVKTVTQADHKSSSRSPAVTEVKLARDVPLPISGATSHVSRDPTPSQPHDIDKKSELGSVAPSDSISQAGSRKSKGSKRSSYHGRSRSGLEAVQEDSGSRISERTVLDRGSRTRRSRESAISLPMRPSSKASAHRSVKSFMPGL